MCYMSVINHPPPYYRRYYVRIWFPTAARIMLSVKFFTDNSNFL